MTDGRTIISLVADRQDLEQFRKKNWEGTFEAYLDLVRSQPEVARNAFERVYENTRAHWDAYHLCEDLVDLESQFQLWRFRHMRTVMRIIGFKKGTGGSSGVGFLKQALELTFFPELFEVRTVIGGPAGEKPY